MLKSLPLIGIVLLMLFSSLIGTSCSIPISGDTAAETSQIGVMNSEPVNSTTVVDIQTLLVNNSDVLSSGWWSDAEYVDDFENSSAGYVREFTGIYLDIPSTLRSFTGSDAIYTPNSFRNAIFLYETEAKASSALADLRTHFEKYVPYAGNGWDGSIWELTLGDKNFKYLESKQISSSHFEQATIYFQIHNVVVELAVEYGIPKLDIYPLAKTVESRIINALNGKQIMQAQPITYTRNYTKTDTRNKSTEILGNVERECWGIYIHDNSSSLVNLVKSVPGTINQNLFIYTYFDWIKNYHPGVGSIKDWSRTNKYVGSSKNDSSILYVNPETIKQTTLGHQTLQWDQLYSSTLEVWSSKLGVEMSIPEFIDITGNDFHGLLYINTSQAWKLSTPPGQVENVFFKTSDNQATVSDWYDKEFTSKGWYKSKGGMDISEYSLVNSYSLGNETMTLMFLPQDQGIWRLVYIKR